MVNNLRMDLRRLKRSGLLFWALGVLVVLMVGVYAVYAFFAGDSLNAAANDPAALSISTAMESFLGEVPVFLVISYTALTFAAQDFRDGFCKNLFTYAHGRRDYVLGRMVSMLIVSTVLVGAVYLAGVILGLCGAFNGLGGTVADWLCSAVQQILGCWAYAMFAQFLATLLPQGNLSSIILFLRVFSILRTVLFVATEILHLSALYDLTDYAIGAQAQYQPFVVSQGNVGQLMQSVLFLLVWGVMYAALTELILKRRDVI